MIGQTHRVRHRQEESLTRRQGASLRRAMSITQQIAEVDLMVKLHFPPHNPRTACRSHPQLELLGHPNQ